MTASTQTRQKRIAEADHLRLVPGSIVWLSELAGALGLVVAGDTVPSDYLGALGVSLVSSAALLPFSVRLARQREL